MVIIEEAKKALHEYECGCQIKFIKKEIDPGTFGTYIEKARLCKKHNDELTRIEGDTNNYLFATKPDEREVLAL